MAYLLSPVCNESQIDNSGAPLSGGTIETYVAGTSTPTATFTSSVGNIPQTNPIVLNTLGLPPQPIWLDSLLLYKFVVKDSNGIIQRTIDNIQGVSGSIPPPADQWVLFNGNPTFINTTSFSLTGDQTSIFQVGRRVRTVNTGGTVYSTILTSVFTTLTTITLANDSGVLDTGLSQVAYGILSPQNTSVPNTVALSSYLSFTGVAELTTGGTVPNYTISSALPLTSYVIGQRLRIKFHAAGDINPPAQCTLNINGLGAIPLSSYGTAAPYRPAITLNCVYDVEYDGTRFAILNAIDGSQRVGELIDWPNNSTPSYALLCNGAGVSRTTYSRLFAVIGTFFGAGDGVTTFNLPNVPAGYVWANSNGSNAGSSTVGQNLAHTHNYSADNSQVQTLQGGTAGVLTHLNGFPYGPTDTGTNSGSANLAAAIYSRKCIVF